MQSQSKIVLSKHTCCALSCRVAQYMESHPARVRESKYPVARPHSQKSIGRTLRGCANRNRVRTAYPKGRKASHLTRVRESKRTNLHTGKDAPGRTLRGHANQNKLKHCHEHYKRGRTSRGCANQNRGIDAFFHQGNRRTLRGCANRNVRPVVSKTALASSHPTRVCESESGSGWMYRLCSMRARESKCSEGRRAYDDLLSHLTRVRESKRQKNVTGRNG